MARGTLHLAWINRGAEFEEQYHVMYHLEGGNKTMKARNVRGKSSLTTLLEEQLNLLPERVNRIVVELDKSGSSSVTGLNVSDSDLKRLELA